MSEEFLSWLSHRKYLSVTYHKPGRIKLKLALSALGELQKSDGKRLWRWLEGLKGVKRLSTSMLTFTLTIDYDKNLIAPTDWQTVVCGDEEQARTVLMRLNEQRAA